MPQWAVKAAYTQLDDRSMAARLHDWQRTQQLAPGVNKRIIWLGSMQRLACKSLYSLSYRTQGTFREGALTFTTAARCSTGVRRHDGMGALAVQSMQRAKSICRRQPGGCLQDGQLVAERCQQAYQRALQQHLCTLIACHLATQACQDSQALKAGQMLTDAQHCGKRRAS